MAVYCTSWDRCCFTAAFLGSFCPEGSFICTSQTTCDYASVVIIIFFNLPKTTRHVLEVTQFQLTAPLCVSNLLLDLCCSGLFMSCPPIRQKCQRRKTKVTQLWLHFITRCLCIYFNTYSVAFLYHTFRNMTQMSKKDRGLEGIRRSQTRLEFAQLTSVRQHVVFFCVFYFMFMWNIQLCWCKG